MFVKSCRIAFLFFLACALAGCPTEVDDDDSAVDDDDDAADDDDVADDDDDDVVPTEVAEVEPNDVHPFQDLGTLGSGRWVITGVAETGGHEPDGEMNPTGDLDVFAFRLDADADADFLLEWDSAANDFDMMIYADVTAATELTFPGAWNSDGTSFDTNSESASVSLASGTEFAVMVSLWEGADGTPWTLTIDVE